MNEFWSDMRKRTSLRKLQAHSSFSNRYFVYTFSTENNKMYVYHAKTDVFPLEKKDFEKMLKKKDKNMRKEPFGFLKDFTKEEIIAYSIYRNYWHWERD